MRDGHASMTARRVAAQRRHFPRVEVSWGDAAADDRLHDDVAGGLRIPETAMTRHLRSRTAFFDRITVDTISGGVDQVVSVGAGYDGRSFRYGRPGITWFELDHPATQSDKVARLARLGLRTDAATFVAADFSTDDPGQALVRAGLDASLATLFTCEGVASYLTDDVLGGLFRSLARVAAPGSLLVSTVALKPETLADEARRTALRAALATMGEPLRSAISRDELPRFFSAAGWEIIRGEDAAGTRVEQSTRTAAFVIAVPSGQSPNRST